MYYVIQCRFGEFLVQLLQAAQRPGNQKVPGAPPGAMVKLEAVRRPARLHGSGGRDQPPGGQAGEKHCQDPSNQRG